MTREGLIACIKRHGAQCTWPPNSHFSVAAVVELADGILAVRESDGEHTIYFDKSKYGVRSRSGGVEDIGGEIPNFPYDVGFIEDVYSKSWRDIAQITRLGLKAVNRKKIRWHKHPVKIEY